MIEKAKSAVVASFVADSFALGAHWIYDTSKIEQKFGRIETLLKPSDKSYHAGKDEGEFTHYGDQMFVLLESVAAKKGFDPDDFAIRWQDLFKNYTGYFDSATKVTLKNFASGKSPDDAGSSSTDLAGAARIAPLLLCCHDDLEGFVEASRVQTKMTHNHPRVVASSAFFAEVVSKVLHGHSPVSAIKEVAQAKSDDEPIDQWVETGLGSVESNTVSAITGFGQACNISGAFPGVVHLIAKYENDFKQALVENVMAGGDSSARGMIAGMVLGAHLGEEAIPREWLSGLKRYQKIMELLNAGEK